MYACLPCAHVSRTKSSTRSRCDGAPNGGAHRAAARRALPQGGDVEIAVERQGQRAGNRRGGQEQHVRGCSLPDERGALLHAEAMLLVDHHQSQPPKRDALLEQRVGTHDDPRLACGNPLPHRCLLGGGLPPQQQLRLELQRRQQRFQRGTVLLGQQLGGSHERGLEVVLHRQQHREESHHRLSGAHVAHQQPVHAVRRRHVGGDLPQRRAAGPR